jgi:magnesium transporter
MRKYLFCEANGFAEIGKWIPNCWVNVECPDEDDFKFLKNKLKVPESFLNDIADTDERPRNDTEGDWLLTILRIPITTGSQLGVPFNTVPIGIMTNNEIIVSVCYYQSELLPDFIEYTRRKRLMIRNKLDLILRIIYSSAVWFLKYLKLINNDVTVAEKALERSIRNEDLLQLMKLQKTLVYFNTSIRGNEVMITKLKTIFQTTNYLDKDLAEDAIIELKQALNTVNIYSDILTGTMDAFASIINNNVNTIMKRMTSISIILMVPTLIASFYGMNVKIHGSEIPNAFILIILFSLFLSTLAFVIFRKIKWF